MRLILLLALSATLGPLSFAQTSTVVPDPDSELLAATDDPAVAFSVEGAGNNFFGTGAGASITTGGSNSFFGGNAGHANTGGWFNSFFGRDAGLANTDAHYNSFFGAAAGFANTTGSWNSFFGYFTGFNNTTGHSNAFFGDEAGYNNNGIRNSFFGSWSGHANTTGQDNCFLGIDSGSTNTVEHFNTFVGAISDGAAGISNATALGYRAQATQSNSLVLGSIAGVNGATSYVNVGIGTPAPARQLHLAGPNAVFRMDRPSDTAAFIMIRTDPTGVTPWKSFVVGTNATGPNQGEFIINDIAQETGGLGYRRLTITNSGSVQFTGPVYAPSFNQTSSASFKTNIRTYENALETVNRLRGVRFNWKDSGKPAVGLIAEEVQEVLPEIVAREDGKASGVNYANLVAVLVEAVKEQQATIREERMKNEEQQKTIEKLERQQQEFQALRQEMERLRRLLGEK